ncbi:MAG: glycine cleavage system aminomethyltransferase GcvT [Thermoplasmata archaeon]|nr:glycine cleavage system aminomethyltransferase GcvT [Thermoplasmata archaeon]MCI4362282.1 glycine cleavage system aminomethyltransferase GcvT [Thermoplasmata archaeon]
MTESAATAPSAAPPPVVLQQSPLASFHHAHGGHMVPFSGWELPLYYTSILAEHDAVRTGVGLFDVSHMGIVTVDGATAPALLSRRTTANVARLVPGQCRYTFLLEATGWIVDDLLITRLDTGGAEGPRFLAVPNAARAGRIVEMLRQHRRPDTTIAQHNGKVAILAVQGPKASETLERVFGWSLAGLGNYRGRWFPADRGGDVPVEGADGLLFPHALGRAVFVSRTGYTGEAGFELFVAAARAPAVAEALVTAGVVPCGLGARNTLRLEKGYLLSGQDFDRDRTPLEAGQDRFVEFDHPFVGDEALQKQKTEGNFVRLVGLSVTTPGAIPRHGTPIRSGADLVGTVASGGLSPTLHKGIALAFLPPALAAVGQSLTLDLRGASVPAEVVRLPFLASGAARRDYTLPPT